MRQKLFVAIAGAGPAGLATALYLVRAGHRVTLVERFREPQPLGSGLMLQPTGMAVLRNLGLAERIQASGRRIDRLFGRVMPSNRVILDVRYQHSARDHVGIAVHRAALFGTLFDAVAASGVSMETGKAIAGVDNARAGSVSLLLADGSRLGSFDLIVDAMGARSPLAAHYAAGDRRELTYGALWASLPWLPGAGFEHNALEQRYGRASVMVGVLPIGVRSIGEPEQTAFFWSIKPGDYEAWKAGGLDRWKDRVCQLWPATESLVERITDPDQLTLARYSHHTLRQAAVGRVVAIGDSAHAASPQLGQGANMALLDARALALALDESPDVATALNKYIGIRRWHVRYYQVLSALFTPFYQSDSTALPILRDLLVAPATRLPLVRNFVAKSVAGVIIDPRRRLRLEAT